MLSKIENKGGTPPPAGGLAAALLIGIGLLGAAIPFAGCSSNYNALIAIYGAALTPALQPDAGLTAKPDGTWLIDREHLVDLIVMSRWLNMGRPISKP